MGLTLLGGFVSGIKKAFLYEHRHKKVVTVYIFLLNVTINWEFILIFRIENTEHYVLLSVFQKK